MTAPTQEAKPNDIFPDASDCKLAREIHRRFCGGIDESCTDETEWIAQSLAEHKRTNLPALLESHEQLVAALENIMGLYDAPYEEWYKFQPKAGFAAEKAREALAKAKEVSK